MQVEGSKGGLVLTFGIMGFWPGSRGLQPDFCGPRHLEVECTMPPPKP